MCEETRKKTKSRTIKDDKWESKKYIDKSKEHKVKEIIKIRLSMWDLKINYRKREKISIVPAHYVRIGKRVGTSRVCGRDEERTQSNIKHNTEKEW